MKSQCQAEVVQTSGDSLQFFEYFWPKALECVPIVNFISSCLVVSIAMFSYLLLGELQFLAEMLF